MAETVSSATQGEILLSEDMYTKKGVDELIAATVKGGVTPKGSSAFADLPTPGSTNVGWMYDVSDAFTTTSSFVEGAGKNYPAHTNIYVVNPSTGVYKFDVLPGEGPQPYTSNPAANGTASAGSSPNFARGDHVHQTDQTRQAKITASGILKGDGSGGVTAATAGTDYVAPSALSSYVPTSRTVNGKPLSADVTLGCGDINYDPDTTLNEKLQLMAGTTTSVSNRVSAIETAAGTLFTALSGLDASSMTSANAIRTLVASLLSYLKSFAAASDNDASTSDV